MTKEELSSKSVIAKPVRTLAVAIRKEAARLLAGCFPVYIYRSSLK